MHNRQRLRGPVPQLLTLLSQEPHTRIRPIQVPHRLPCRAQATLSRRIPGDNTPPLQGRPPLFPAPDMRNRCRRHLPEPELLRQWRPRPVPRDTRFQIPVLLAPVRQRVQPAPRAPAMQAPLPWREQEQQAPLDLLVERRVPVARRSSRPVPPKPFC